MNKPTLLAVLLAGSGIQSAISTDAPAEGVMVETAPEQVTAKETPAQRDARMAWWREAKFGLFIHWGV